MSSQSAQVFDSDLLIFEADGSNFPLEHSPSTAMDHSAMQLEEVDHLYAECEPTTEPDKIEARACTVVAVEASNTSPTIQSELDRQLKICAAELEEDVVDGLLAGLQRACTPHPPSQASSDGSSLEPLSEAFDVPASLSPPLSHRELQSHRQPDPAQCSSTPSKRMTESEVLHHLGPASPTLTTQATRATRSHKRAKSDTPSTVNSPTEERKHWTASAEHHGSPIGFSHFHLASACAYGLPVSVPPSPRRAPISLSSPLIADVNVAKSRVLVTKTHCFYPERSTLIPFPSCLLGFQLVFHSSDPKARIKHSQIKLTTFSSEDSGGGSAAEDAPIIKAIYPSQGMIHKTGDQTLVRRVDENSIGVKLGVDPYGAMIISHTQSRTQERYTAPYLLGSGIETNKLLITMNEDSSSHAGVPPSLAFAILLYLPSTTTKAFHAELTIETSVRHEIGASFRKIWASPKVWKINYDGKTELGCLKIQ